MHFVMNIQQGLCIDYRVNRTHTAGMKEEEERIKLKEETKGDQCIELPSSFVTNEDLSNNPIEILTDYPHVCVCPSYLSNIYVTIVNPVAGNQQIQTRNGKWWLLIDILSIFSVYIR